MEIKRFFSGKKEVVLSPCDFKEVILSACPSLTEKYNIGKIFFAECYERELRHYPLVIMKLTSKNDDKTDYACFIPLNAKMQIWSGKLSYRELGYRDVAHKMELWVDGQLLEGKIVMNDGELGFRFRTT